LPYILFLILKIMGISKNQVFHYFKNDKT